MSETGGTILQLDTKYFGRIDYRPEDVLSFPNGLFGFENEREFLLLPFAGSEENLLCLQSVNAPSPAFIAMNPFSLNPQYAPQLSAEELRSALLEQHPRQTPEL